VIFYCALVKLISSKAADVFIGCVSWLNDFIGQFFRATEPCPQKSAHFFDCLPSLLCCIVSAPSLLYHVTQRMNVTQYCYMHQIHANALLMVVGSSAFASFTLFACVKSTLNVD